MRITLILLLLLASFTTIAADNEIRLGVHHFPPYFIRASDAICNGSAVDLTRDILQNKNIQVTTVCATPARLYKMLETGEIDLTINIKYTLALPENVSFIEPPYARMNLVLLTQAVSVMREPQPTIAAIRSFDYHGQRQILQNQGYNFIDLPDSISAVEMFLKGRSSALITYEAPFNYYLQQHNLASTKHYKRQLLETINGHYVVSDHSPYKAYISETLQRYASDRQLSYLAD